MLKNKDISGGLRVKEREKSNMVKVKLEEKRILGGREHAKDDSLQMLKETNAKGSQALLNPYSSERGHQKPGLTLPGGLEQGPACEKLRMISEAPPSPTTTCYELKSR